MDEELARALDAYVDARVNARLGPLTERVAALEAAPTPAPTPTPTPIPPVLPAPGGSPAPRATRRGMNLCAPQSYEPVWAFTDLMMASHVNSSKLGDFSWMGSAGITLDSDGWPVGLAPGQSVDTGVAKMGGHYPSGEYLVTWEGTGTVVLTGDAVGTLSAPTRVMVSPSTNGINVKITRSMPGNPLRNLRIMMPGESPSTLFHPLYLSTLAPFGVLRFMDWGRTNNSEQSAWSDRPKTTHRSQARGVAYEYMIALANALGADPWVCIPHKASQEYVAAMAAMFKDKLRTDLRVYLEYTNEAWNGGFTQKAWIENLSPTENFVQTYARIATTHFKTWERAWGSRERLVRVLASQAANADVGKQILTAAGQDACDALAIAPYIGGSVGANATAGTWSVDQILTAVEADLILWRQRMEANKAVAEAGRVALVAYEGGQHLAPAGALQEDTALVQKLIDANRDERMGVIYKKYFEHWRAIGGGLFCHFNDVYTPKKYGSWGMLEWQDQPPTPKSRAVNETAAAWRG